MRRSAGRHEGGASDNRQDDDDVGIPSRARSAGVRRQARHPHFIDINLEYALGANLGGQNLIALIGRDLLQSAVLVYNGTDGTVSLSI